MLNSPRIIYIKSLTIRREDVLQSDRSTGFLGFLINIESLRILYNDLILTKKLHVILFFFLGQDLLESLFSHVRGFLGGNDNPSATQLIGSVRKLLIENEFKASEDANCDDHLNLLYVPSTTSKSKIDRVKDKNISDKRCPEIDIEELDSLLLRLEQSELVTIKLRAGTIENKLRFTCMDCSRDLDKSQKIDGYFPRNMNRPSETTVTICKIAFLLLSKYLKNQKDLYFFNYESVQNHILCLVLGCTDDLFMNFDFSHNVEHEEQLIINIADEYIKLHNTHLARQLTIKSQSELIGEGKKIKTQPWTMIDNDVKQCKMKIMLFYSIQI